MPEEELNYYKKVIAEYHSAMENYFRVTRGLPVNNHFVVHFDPYEMEREINSFNKYDNTFKVRGQHLEQFTYNTRGD